MVKNKGKKKEKVKKEEKVDEGAVEVFPKSKVRKINIRFIGIGGGGGAIVSEISKRIDKATFVAANTDLNALKYLPKKVKPFSFGEDVTGGLGTGMNVELSEELAEKEKDRIKKLFKGQDVCIFVSTLGGGTGSGASPVFVKISQEFPTISLGIFTLPFHFEGKKKLQIAKESLEKMKSFLNGYFIIPNDRIFQMVEKKTSLRKGLFLLNRILAERLKEIIDLIFLPGIINIDFADFKTIFNTKGKVFFINTAEASGNERTDKIIDNIFSSPLGDYNIGKAEGILFNIAGTGDLKMEEVREISKAVSHLNKNARIIFGVSKGEKTSSTRGKESSQKGKIKLTLLIVGSEKEKEKKKKIKKKNLLKREKKEKKKTKKKEKFISGRNKESDKKEKVEKEDKESKEAKKRKTALEVRKELASEEEEILKKENEWETPAFLRKGIKKIKISRKK